MTLSRAMEPVLATGIATLALASPPAAQSPGAARVDPKAAQEPQPTPEASQDSLAELKARLAALEAASAAEREDLRFEIESLRREVEAARAAASRPATSAQNAFNPAITVFGNFLARVDDRPVFVDDLPTEPRIDDQFNLREVELDFRAAIDPWADGVLITSIESEVPNEFDVSVEEGYVQLKRLPLLDSAPWGLKTKIGRFRPEFGRFNQIHLHDLPQPSYPNSLQTFLGPEGYIQNGVSGQFFLPSWSESQTLEATLQVLDGGDLEFDENAAPSQLTTLARVKWFGELETDHSVELGVSGLNQDSDHQLYGLDATYKWKPLAGGEWHSFLLGGEVFAADLADPALASNPFGWYTWAQYQFDKNLYLGLRYDETEELADDDFLTRTVGAYLTFYTTEFLRFRLGVEHAWSDLAELDDRDTALIEINFIYGSHPVEPYWVNR